MKKTLIIIGAGPAGLAAALEAKKNNFKVIILKKKINLEVKERVISIRNLYLIMALMHFMQQLKKFQIVSQIMQDKIF